ncbi:hypothetical protein CPB86DRAFT_203780 [Serendipita vermifera]|nr:hypothetical protein CPB86DRAFT_203780 [Serendipita vermifera]
MGHSNPNLYSYMMMRAIKLNSSIYLSCEKGANDLSWLTISGKAFCTVLLITISPIPYGFTYLLMIMRILPNRQIG